MLMVIQTFNITCQQICYLSVSLKVGYAAKSSCSATTQLSAKEVSSTLTSEATGRKLEMISVGLTSIDGLSIKGVQLKHEMKH